MSDPPTAHHARAGELGEPSDSRASSHTQRGGWWNKVEWALYLVFAASLGVTEVANHDIGLHLLTGQHILQHGPPSTNVFSEIHETREMVDDKWLFQGLVAWVHGFGGYEALTVLKALLVLALAWSLARSAEDGRGRGSLLLCGLGLLAAHSRFMVRPDLVSLLFVALTVLLLRRFHLFAKRGALVGLILIQVLWVNTHGYYILGPLIVGVFGLGLVVDERRRLAPRGRGKVLLAMASAMAVSCLANPYGVEGALYAIETLRDLRDQRDVYAVIAEFRPTFAYTPALTTDAIAYRTLLIAAPLLLLIEGRKKVLLSSLVLLGVTLAMSLDLQRNMGIYAIVAASFATTSMAKALRGTRFAGISSLLTSIGFVGLIVWTWSGVRAEADRSLLVPGFGESFAVSPRCEVDFLLAEDLPGRFWNPFDHGSYLALRLAPKRRPLIDGNTSGYDAAFLREHVEETRGEVPLALIREKRGIDYYLVQPEAGLARVLFEDPGYRPLAAGLHLIVFVPDNETYRPWIESSSLESDLSAGRIPASIDELLGRGVPWDDVKSLVHWVAGLSAAGLIDAAQAFASRALSLGPHLAEAHHAAGMVAWTRGDGSAAREALDRALELEPGVATVWADRGRLAREFGDFEAAASDLRQSLSLRSDADVWFELARTEHEAGRRAERIDALRHCLQEDADHVPAALDLSRLLLASPEGREEAEALLNGLLGKDISTPWRSMVEEMLTDLRSR